MGYGPSATIKKTLVEPAITPLHFYYFPIFAQFVKTVLVLAFSLQYFDAEQIHLIPQK
jgi:hypothetical protein